MPERVFSLPVRSVGLVGVVLMVGLVVPGIDVLDDSAAVYGYR